MLEMKQWRATAQCVQVRLATTHVGACVLMEGTGVL